MSLSKAVTRLLVRASAPAILLLSPGTGTAEEPREWVTAVQPDPAATVTAPAPVIPRSSRIESAIAAFVDSPDVAVTTASNTTQSENSVFVSPLNPLLLLNSNNSSDWPVTQIYGASSFVSTDGGLSWTGSIGGTGGTNRGDPTTAIDRNGRMFVGYIAFDYGQGVSYSDNNGASWTPATVAPGPYILDKNHLWVDNSATSPHEGNLYSAWTNFQAGTADGEIEFMRSTNGGSSWTSRQSLSTAVAAGSHNQGVNIQTAPNGDVYVVWTIYDAWPTDETALGFARSTDGGQSFSAGQRILSGIRGHRNTALGGGKTMRHNSFPSMTVNQQTGQIFVVWTNIGVPGINTGDPDIYLISSTNGGTSWSTPSRVNQDALGNGKDNYFPWIACDPASGVLALVSYDSRNFAANDFVETFTAVSTDNGATWQDFRVSDVAWSGDGIPGFAAGYAGDYLGVAVRNNQVYPMWMDTRAGNALTYISPFAAVADTLPPVADFSGSPTSGSAPLGVQFTDLSTHSPTSWLWSFGDAGTSTAQNPFHTYASAGTYTVSLTATNAYGSDTATKTNYITVTTTPTPNIHVSSIVVDRVSQPGSAWKGRALVTIVDETGAPVSGARVSGFFNAPDSRTKNANTNASGVATVLSAKTKSPPANWCFTVSNVTLSGETYDPGQNVESTDCETGLAGESLASMQVPDSPLEPTIRAAASASGAEIELGLDVPSHVKLEIFDVRGRHVATVADAAFDAGRHGLAWDGRGVADGIYFYRVEIDGRAHTGKVVLLR